MQHWRNPSKYEYIRDGLAELAKALYEYNIKSIAIPPLGCGNGGLNWDIVKKMIIEALENNEAEIYIFEPNTEIKQALHQRIRANERHSIRAAHHAARTQR